MSSDHVQDSAVFKWFKLSYVEIVLPQCNTQVDMYGSEYSVVIFKIKLCLISVHTW